MPPKAVGILLVVMGLGFVLAGCNDKTEPPVFNQTVKKIAIPPGTVGTVSEYADMVGGEPLLVQGYGLVVGLGLAGSPEIPADVKRYLVRVMHKANIGSYVANTQDLKPEMILADKDTAVVIVSGYIPPGAPAGTRFDLNVECLPNNQTTSLEGGNLMSADLRLALTTDTVDIKPMAAGKGSVFVNPFIQRDDPTQTGKLRSGRVANGGVVTADRPVKIQLRQPDYRMAQLIQRRLNERFGPTDKVANAMSPSLVAVRIPKKYAKDFNHFYDLVAHTYLIDLPGEQERHARQLVNAVQLPNPRAEDISLVWEAMGNQVLPAIREIYASDNETAAFYSCRAGLRLGDHLALEPLTRLAAKEGSLFQIDAIRELGRATGFVQPLPTLREALNSGNDMVRIAAYEALVDHGDLVSFNRTTIPGQFAVDIVPGEQGHLIYATQTGEPRIVLFGRNMPVSRPTFYCPKDQMVTINANPGESVLNVYRKIPRTGKMSENFQVKPETVDLIATLGNPPKFDEHGKVMGLGLSYSQVLGVVQNMSKEGQIPAKFVLQQSQALQRIYPLTAGIGRPDRPEDAPSTQ